MSFRMIRFTVAAIAACAACTVLAQPVIYPAGGQSAEQQQNDDAECRAWATTNTGVDPAALATASAQQQSELAQQAAQPAAAPPPRRARSRNAAAM